MKLLATILALLSTASLGHVLSLQQNDFDSVVGGADPVFVKFFAPWCGHCKRLAPTWESLSNEKAFKVAHVDCTSEGGKEVCAHHGIQGYPTLKFFSNGLVYEYSGGRSLEDLKAFATSGFAMATGVPVEPLVQTVEVGAESGDIADPFQASDSSSVRDLDDGSFEHDTQAATGGTTGVWLVEFYAPWCPHCKSFAPKYEKVAKELSRRGAPVNVARVDATVSPSTARRFGVRSFPSLRLIKSGQVWEYPSDQPRTVQSVADFADGGFAKLTPSAVPAPPSFWMDLSREGEEAWADLVALVRSKPNAMTVAVSAGFVLGMVTMLIIALVTNIVAPLDIPPAAVDVAARVAAHEAVGKEEAIPEGSSEIKSKVSSPSETKSKVSSPRRRQE